MKKIAIQIFLLFLTGMLLTPVIADVPIEGMKQYNYQYVINNSADYPEYLFLTSSEIWGYEHPSIVVNGSFGGGYKLDGFVLHAMKEADLNPLIREELGTVNQKTDLPGYFTSAPLVTSEVMLPVATNMDDTVPLTNLTILLQIQNITNAELNVTKIRTIYGFENGTTIDQVFQGETDDTQPGTPGA